MLSSKPAMAAHSRSLYRSLLRELPPRPLLATPRAPLHASLRAVFASPPDPPTAAKSHALQLLSYLRAQRHYVALLDRYNPSIHLQDDERVRLSARRVGMNMPHTYQPK
ncbi:hypothetical protein CDD82_1356 [Ophiocordyceps australis]|uniref:ATP synthase assembly factor FMC1, mitochondrial n=1 Tax=Ophiocordyceps australis TaxID=1399860 RepID=A0A2C5ZML7_9HYPO|nr:hypothetical protein CDD82_1356 [Ophiocordyceps australis]